MKAAITCFALLIVAGLGWLYEAHVEVFTDAVADITNDPTGVRATLQDVQKQLDSAHTQIDDGNKKISDLSNSIVALQNQNKELQAKVALAAPSPIQTPNSAAYAPPSPLPSQSNWTWTVLGKDYHDVTVTAADADTVSITYDGGIGTINTSDLTPELQKMFNYDPDLAAASARQKREASERVDAEESLKIAALQQEEKRQADANVTQASANSSSHNTRQSSAPIDPAVAIQRQQRIRFLEDDIDEKLRHMGGGGNFTQGAYPQIISDDRRELVSYGVYPYSPYIYPVNYNH